MATYNGVQFIEEQLDSIRNQTRKLDEVLIYDDGSNDGTITTVKEYILKYNLKNWVFKQNKKNMGYSANFAQMLKKTTGDIIFLADQDDIWSLEKVENMVKVMSENSDIQLLASDLSPLYMSDTAPKINYEQFNKGKELIEIKFGGRWIKPVRPGCSYCIRKEIITQFFKIWSKDFPHDCILWNISCLSDGAWYYNKPMMKYRRHENNASNLGKRNIEYRISCIDEELEIINTVLQNSEMLNIENKDTKIKFLQRQNTLYSNRKASLKNRNFITLFLNILKIRYMGRSRYWFTDLYYILKK